MRYLILLFFPVFMVSQSGRDIANMISERPSPNDMTNITEMVLTNSKGKVRTHTMISKSVDGNKKQIMWFVEPKNDRGIAFLKIEHDSKDDEMRMWLPAFKRVRRISSKKKGDSFMGSDLNYEDLSSRELDNNEYKRLDDMKWMDRDCYVIETTPKDEARSSYARHVSWIDKNDMTILREESFNRKNDLEKEKLFLYEKVGEYQLIKQVFVKNLIEAHTTKVIFSEMEIDAGIDHKLFNEMSLRRLPLE